MAFLLTLLAVGLASAAPALNVPSAYPPPMPINGPPAPHHLTIDPSLIRRASDNKLFLYMSGGKNDTLWTADSLYGPWTLTPSPEYGAPQAYNVNGIYYLFSSRNYEPFDPETDHHVKASDIIVATSPDMEPSSWQEHGRIDVPYDLSVHQLDGSLLSTSVNGATQNFLNFGSYFGGLYQIPLTNPPTAATPNAEVVHLAYNSSSEQFNHDPIEASFPFQWGPWYYLFFSSGKCCENSGRVKHWPTNDGDAYKVMVCRSRDPSGGFMDRDGKSCLSENGGTEILGSHDGVYAPGGQGVMVDEEAEGPMIYYHYLPRDGTGPPGQGYRFGWNKLDFGEDGWPTVCA